MQYMWRQIHRSFAPLRDFRLPSLIFGLRRVVRLVCASSPCEIFVVRLVMVSSVTGCSTD